MDEWLKQLQASLHEAAKDSSDWFADVSQQSNDVIEAWVASSIETLESVEKSVENAVTPALEDALESFDTRVDEAVDASIVFLNEEFTPWIEETAAPLTRTVNPWLQHHPACIGCKFYHGTAYGDEMLVCGMHPYGPDDRNCEDWESVWSGAGNQDS
ncbi:MAG: hypothetical protein AAFQ63_09435 [Cyanobacteria bacterium J06621_11]